MIYGRVIGSELRDVPPECLPVWGQRWSSYRVPHGPSPFSIRTLSVDQMSEVGPVLTSPSQFEAVFTEEEAWKDAYSEAGQFYTSFSSSSLTNQMVATEMSPRFVCCPSNRRGSPEMLHWRTGHPPPQQDSTHFDTPLSPKENFNQLDIQHHALEPLLPTHGLCDEIPGQDSRESLENDYTLWDVGCASTSAHSQAGPSQENHVLNGQSQYIIPPYSIPDWQISGIHTQCSAHTSLLDLPSHSGDGQLLQPFWADNQTRFVLPTPPTPSHLFSRALPHQNIRSDPLQNHESSVTTNSGILYAHNTMSLVPLDSELFCQSEHQRLGSSSYLEDLPGTTSCVENCTL